MSTLPEKFTNLQLAETFQLIANLLEIKGEVIYKILAYRKGSESLTNLGRDVNAIYQEGGVKALMEIPGVGKAIAEKIEELITTGRLGFLEKLSVEVPMTLADMIPVPDLGPKKIKLFWQTLGITTLAGLQEAARAGQLRALPGMGEKSEAKILAGIESLSRRTGRTPLEKAWPFAEEQLALLRGVKGVVAAEVAGSLRRMRETVGDVDILVAATLPELVMAAFTTQGAVARVLGGGPIKSSVEFTNGMRAQVWVHPPEKFGTALQYATGSKDHNVRMRELALKQGLSLSEHALTPVDGGAEILCATEEEVYTRLGIPWVAPELREDRGEMAAALAGTLPRLVTVDDLHADLHMHSTWSDGKSSILEMAQAARARGHRVIAITDHSHSLGIVQGMKPEDIAARQVEIDAAQAEMGETIRILSGVEVEIKADGTLDYPDEVLAGLDVVIASLHVSLRQPREQITERLLNAIRNPHVDIIGHPTGRQIPDREGADLDMDAVLAAAKESGVALEINANPRRLDLNDVYARRAKEMGIPLTINTDAHAPEQLALLHFGVAVARRAWVEAGEVINAWGEERMRGWLKKKGS